MNKDTAIFIIKVVVISALLSLLIKVGGPVLPIDAPYTENLNGLVTAIVILPSIAIGAGLLWVLKSSSQQSL